MKKIEYSKQAAKFIRKLDKKTQIRIIRAIESIPLGNIVSLKGFGSLKRLRIGDYRVIFDDSGEILYIAKIGNRGDIYK